MPSQITLKATTITALLQYGNTYLYETDNDRYHIKLDCEILLLQVLNHNSTQYYTKTWLLTWPEHSLTDSQIQQFKHYLKLRLKGTPIAYIIGQQDFWSLTLKVTPDTLIPRPDSELLVECALDKIPFNTHRSLLDLGTGSGAIALAIASERVDINILATDISHAALTIAQYNAKQLQFNSISFCQSHWFNNITAQTFDIILSNPPYIAKNDPDLADNVKNYEPLSALISDNNGLADIIEIMQHSCHYLKAGGWLLFEHGYQQHKKIQTLFKTMKFNNIQTFNDLNGHPRVTQAQFSHKKR
jgi:release factor glutamine methyltransferase